MVLSHLFHDVESQYTALYGLIPGVIHTPSPLWDMEYADDTVLLSKSSQHATRMLHLIQHFGAQRGLHINEDKCDHLRLNSEQRIYYSTDVSSPTCSCDSCMDSVLLSPASSYYHRVLNPSDAECSNEYLAGLAYSRRVITPSQYYSQQRLKLFGHPFRHPESLEYQSSFMPSGAYRFIPGPNRVGRPGLHWAESCMAEAANSPEHPILITINMGIWFLY